MKALYTAVATTTGGGRNGGSGATSDGKVTLSFSMPKDLGGPGGDGTNPEQLVALGYSACFGSALAFVAGQKKIAAGRVAVTCKVVMGRNDAGGFAFEFEIEASLPDLPQADADALVAAAHQVCPYSNAFRNGAPTKATAKGRA
ncbi:MAG: Ohr family peroxiredoxin [Rhodospirillaceae bacterium]|nr:Ohr family peroxiredoxin [Rhodospirillaceae bacterium]